MFVCLEDTEIHWYSSRKQRLLWGYIWQIEISEERKERDSDTADLTETVTGTVATSAIFLSRVG